MKPNTKSPVRKVPKPKKPAFNTSPQGMYNEGKSDAKSNKVRRRTSGSGLFMKTT